MTLLIPKGKFILIGKIKELSKCKTPSFDHPVGFFDRSDMGDVTAVVELVFNSTAPPDQIPQADDVVDVLVEELENGNNTFNLTLDAKSIQVLGKQTFNA